MTAEISPAKFDKLVGQRRPAGERILWTATTIAQRIGTSADFVRDVLVNEPGSPIKIVGGRYAAVESELIDYFRPTSAQRAAAKAY